MDVALPPASYDTATKIVSFYERALERMRALPGVRSVAATAQLPLAGGTTQWSVEIEGRPDSRRDMETPYIVNSTTDIFRAMGIAILRGRAFVPTDDERSTPVTVVSESMAREYWPGQEVLGKRIRLSGPDLPWITIVGVARDVRPEALSEKPQPTYYLLIPQFAKMNGFADQGAMFVLRTVGDPAALTNPARAVVRELDQGLALDRVQTLESVVTNSVARPRFAASVLGAFGIASLALAVVGVYGVLSYAMTRRRRELALRMALGARPGQVSRLVIRYGLGLAAGGVLAGLVVAVVGRRMLTALLYGVSPTDPTTLVAVVVTLLGAATAASWLPARRATAVNPADALRGE